MKSTEKIIWNRLLLALVSVLLGLAIIILLKIVFFPFGFDVKDWGTRSDLLSSISTAIAAVGTLGTLFVALKAYRKADNYIKQKRIDKGIDIGINLISEAFVAYYSSLNNFNLKASTLEDKIMFMGMVAERIHAHSEFQDVKHAIEDLFLKGFEIEKEVMKLQLLKILPSNNFSYDVKINFSRLKKINDLYTKINSHVYEAKTQFELDNTMIISNFESMTSEVSCIRLDITNYFRSNSQIEHYFNINQK